MPVVDRSRRAGTARSGPYDLPAQHRSAAAAQARSQQLHDEPEAGEFIKVSADSKPKAVAGKIAHTAREGGDPPAVLTIGAPCINQAVKAIAIARQYLDEDGLDLNFQPAFRHADRTRPSVALYLCSTQPVTRVAAHEYTISGTSEPRTVAGAISARIREGDAVALTAIGANAVANAVLAVGNARIFLEEDGMDVRCYPSFIHVTKAAEDRTAMQFVIQGERI